MLERIFRINRCLLKKCIEGEIVTKLKKTNKREDSMTAPETNSGTCRPTAKSMFFSLETEMRAHDLHTQRG